MQMITTQLFPNVNVPSHENSSRVYDLISYIISDNAG